MSRVPEYKLLIDWYSHGGLLLPLEGWEAQGASLSPSLDRAVFGDRSLYVTWDMEAPSQRVSRSFPGTPHAPYSVHVWAYVPDGHSDVTVSAIDNGGNAIVSTPVILKDTWYEAILDLPPTSKPVEIRVTPGAVTAETFVFDDPDRGFDKGLFPVPGGASPDSFQFGSTGPNFNEGVFLSGSSVYIGGIRASTADDDMSCRILATRTAPEVSYGRDDARDLDTIKAGDMTFELDNSDGLFTPRNTGAGLGRHVGPNRAVRLFALYEGKEYTLFTGSTTDFVLHADAAHRSVAISATDQIARLSDVTIHTDLYPSIRTGDAIHAILDAAGFTGPRDIDPGASVLRWWARGGVSAKEALDSLMEAEGPPAIYHMGEDGGFFFRDRNHRLKYPRSTTSQVTISECREDSADSVWFLEDSTIEYGWSDVVNVVEADADLATPSSEESSVWQSEETVMILPGESKVYEASVDGGYLKAVQPVGVDVEIARNDGPEAQDVMLGAPERDEPYDYVVLAGKVKVESRYTEGTRVVIEATNTGTDVARIMGMQLRGRLIETEAASRYFSDEASIKHYGDQKSLDFGATTLCPSDVEAVSLKVLNTRAYKRPTCSLVLINHNPHLTREVLTRNFSDLITVDSSLWGINNGMYVEAIDHSIQDLGHEHRVTYTCESEPMLAFEDAFQFGASAEYGFDEGVFQAASLVSPSNVFRLDQSELDGPDRLAY